MHYPVELRASLKRGALVTAANWPVVMVQFVAQTIFTLLLLVPAAGGMTLVRLVMDDTGSLASHDLRESFLSGAAVLQDHPVALASFLLAFLVVLIGGAGITFLVKAGTIGILARADAVAGPVERPPLRWASFQRAMQFSAADFLTAASRFGTRFLGLGAVLLVAYGLSAAGYLGVALIGSLWLATLGTAMGWTFVALLTGAFFVWIALINLGYLLAQIAIVLDDAKVLSAVHSVVGALYRRGSELILIFVMTLALALVALSAAVLATAALGLISFVPFFGLAVIPLQTLAWFARGLVFQYLGLSALSAYLTVLRADGATRAALRETSALRSAS